MGDPVKSRSHLALLTSWLQRAFPPRCHPESPRPFKNRRGGRDLLLFLELPRCKDPNRAKSSHKWLSSGHGSSGHGSSGHDFSRAEPCQKSAAKSGVLTPEVSSMDGRAICETGSRFVVETRGERPKNRKANCARAQLATNISYHMTILCQVLFSGKASKTPLTFVYNQIRARGNGVILSEAKNPPTSLHRGFR